MRAGDARFKDELGGKLASVSVLFYKKKLNIPKFETLVIVIYSFSLQLGE